MIYRFNLYTTEPIFRDWHEMLVNEKIFQSPLKSYITHQQDSASVPIPGALHASVKPPAQAAHVSQKAEMLRLALRCGEVAVHLVNSDSRSVACIFTASLTTPSFKHSASGTYWKPTNCWESWDKKADSKEKDKSIPVEVTWNLVSGRQQDQHNWQDFY